MGDGPSSPPEVQTGVVDPSVQIDRQVHPPADAVDFQAAVPGPFDTDPATSSISEGSNVVVEPLGADDGASEPVEGDYSGVDPNPASDGDISTTEGEGTAATEGAAALEQQAEVEFQRGEAVKFITRAQETGVFTTPEAKSAAELALQSQGQDTKAVLAALRVTGDHVADGSDDLPFVEASFNALSRDFEFTVDGNTYNLDQLERERSDSVTTPERKAEIEAIIDQGLTVEITPGVAIEQAVTEQIAFLEARKAEKKGANESTKNEEIAIHQLKLSLAGGEARHALALAGLKKARQLGAEGLDDVISQGEGLGLVGEASIIKTYMDNGYSLEIAKQIKDKLLQGDTNWLTENGFLGKAGVDRMLFGDSLSDEELQKRLSEIFNNEEAQALWKKHGRNAAVAVLMLIAMGIVPSAKQMLIPSER